MVVFSVTNLVIFASMRLSKIKLAGFKSFVDPTTIHVPSNLVGIIGPNGCGKSNVIDAVRWVMGESSAKNLRGDSMSDVIFNGSNGRKPVGTASIELAFDNSDGTIGGQYAGYNEISIRRQVSRDGTSNYFLNNARCRRRDITDIFLGTGLGPRSYSIIEQGTISRLIEAKPEDLRAFLEEAAGISKYKERRRETENRIKHTRENLDRLNDLLEEIEKQLEKLKRQSRAAERYKELKEEEREVKAQLLALRYSAMHEQCSRREQEIQERELAMQAELAAQRNVEAELEKLREALVEANESFNTVQGRFYKLGADVARVEQAIKHNKESRQQQQQELFRAEQTLDEIGEHIRLDSARLEELAHSIETIEPELAAARERTEQSTVALCEAEEAMQEWQRGWDEFNRRMAERSQSAQVERTRLDHIDRQLQQLDQRLQRMDQERESLSSQSLESELEQLANESTTQETAVAGIQMQQDEVGRRITETRAGMVQQEREFSALQSQHHDTRGRLASLQTLQHAALGQQSGNISGWLTGQGLQSAPRLAQEIQVESGWERAVETALGGYLEAVCVAGLDNAEHLLGGLTQGTVTLFDTGSTAPAAQHDKGMTLVSKVSAPWSMDGLLDGIYAVESLAEALAMRAALDAHESVITRDGVWVGRSWLRVARDSDEKAGVLEREREINELTVQTEAQAGNIDILRQSIAKARESLGEAEAERERLQGEYNQAHRLASDLRARFAACESRLEQQRKRHENVTRESEELRTQKASDAEEHASAQSRLQEALQATEALTQEREERTRRQQQLSSVLTEVRERARNDQQQVHELALRAESMRTARATTQQSLARMREQIQQLSGRRDELNSALGHGNTPLVELEAELESQLTRRLEAEGELDRRAQAGGRHRARHPRIRPGTDSQGAFGCQRSASRSTRIAWPGRKSRCAATPCWNRSTTSGFACQMLLEQLDESASIEVWAERAEKLEQRIQRLGPINLAAIEEYEEESKRKVYLDAQHADLIEALQTLENAIGKIDRETRTRFKETFDKVNEGMQENFPTLFGGGHAYLELTGEDLLDTGVTVMARPPGKRNSTIHLLSGGEKALTAIALVFAIFRLNPSPFCMLDEVDAPLDDANVGRYCDMVRKMSEHVQFIFISHNKITMEMANQLTGVTMHEPGVSRLVAVDIDEAVQMVAV